MVEVRDIQKRFGGVRALDGVTMAVQAGSIHGLVGENGAGKTTLGRIVAGVIEPDGGDLLIDGHPVRYRSPREALRDGTAMITQEVTLVPELSVAESVFLGAEGRPWGRADRQRLREHYGRLDDRIRLGVPSEARVGNLSMADQQKVEVLRAIARNARLIVMDEPTSSLGRKESDRLHDVVRSLRAQGVTVLYVTHFLEEVLQLADRVTVFRNGRLVETVEAVDATAERLVLGMLGQEIRLAFPDKTPPKRNEKSLLRVRHLRRSGALEDISFQVGRGEIVGLAGLVGSGRTEVARAIFGADTVDDGTVEIDGKALNTGSPRQAVKAGIAFVPDDRKRQGLLMELSQRVNLTLPHLREFSRWGITSRRSEQSQAAPLLERLRVDPPQLDKPVKELSGGNQQKVLFGKWLLRPPKLLILDEPTRGVDIGAKQAIYELIAKLADEGMGILLISSESEEITGLAHRVLVMRRGRIAREFETHDLTAASVIHAAFGIDHEPLHLATPRPA